jgi:hypothetical protein
MTTLSNMQKDVIRLAVSSTFASENNVPAAQNESLTVRARLNKEVPEVLTWQEEAMFDVHKMHLENQKIQGEVLALKGDNNRKNNKESNRVSCSTPNFQPTLSCKKTFQQ